MSKLHVNIKYTNIGHRLVKTKVCETETVEVNGMTVTRDVGLDPKTNSYDPVKLKDQDE